MTKQEQEKRKQENEKARIDQTVLLCTEFLLTNASDNELEGRTGISSSTAGRRLTNKDRILVAFDEIKGKLLEQGQDPEVIPETGSLLYDLIMRKRQENLLRGKALGGKTTLMRHVYNKDDFGKFIGSSKIDISKIYKKECNQIKFITHLALVFRLHLDTLSQIFLMDENELLQKINAYSPAYNKAITYLFYHDANDQEIARREFLQYWCKLDNACDLNDKENKKGIINEIFDYKADQFLKNHVIGEKISDEDIEMIAKFQIKYALTQENLCEIFKINRDNYGKRVRKVLENNPSLRIKYEYLTDYNLYRLKEARRYG